MRTIAELAARILPQPPAPVVMVDTCSLLDLFRRDAKRFQPRVPVLEIRAAGELLDLVRNSPAAVHLVLPELVPREFADHADAVEADLIGWTKFHGENQEWLAGASASVNLALLAQSPVGPAGLPAALRALAENLLTAAEAMSRDRACLDRAVSRLIDKTRPSHAKEMKDSMNLEQCLELGRLLAAGDFTGPRVWVSSNTRDFAETATSPRLHPDLEADFTSAGLDYFTSFRAAIGRMRANGQFP